MTATDPTPPKLDARVVVERIRVVIEPRQRELRSTTPSPLRELIPRRGRR